MATLIKSTPKNIKPNNINNNKKTGIFSLNSRAFHSTKLKSSQQLLNHIKFCRTFVSDGYVELPDVKELPSFPRERTGLNYSLNWSLVNLNIAPFYDSNYNIDFKSLQTRSYAKLGKQNKAFYVDQSADVHENKNSTQYYVNQIQSPPPNTYSVWKNTTTVDQKTTNRIEREVGYHISHVPYSYVNDGTAGSSRYASANVRVVSDDPVSATFMRHMLNPIAKITPSEFVAQSVVIDTPAFRFTPSNIVEEFGGPTPKDLGLVSDKFVLTDLPQNAIVSAGNSDRAFLLESIAFLSSRFAFSNHGAVSLPCDMVYNDKGDLTLVVNNTNDKAGVIKNSKLLYGAHHGLWSDKGISRMWNGYYKEYENLAAVEAQKPKEGDLIEQNINSSSRVRLTRSLSKEDVRPNMVQAPKRLVFVVDDPKGTRIPALSRITNELAQRILTSGLKSISENGEPEFYPGFSSNNFTAQAHPHLLGEKFYNLLSQNDTHVYLVNSSAAATEVSNVINGKVATLKSNPISGANGWERVSSDDAKVSDASITSLFRDIDKKSSEYKIQEPAQPAAPQSQPQPNK